MAQNCLTIIRDVEKHDPLTDGFVHIQLMKFCMNTRTQYMSANITLPPQEHFLSAQHIHVDMVIADAIFRKGTRGSFRQWDKNDYDLAVTRLQMPHADGGFGLTPNTIAQTSAKVAMASRFWDFGALCLLMSKTFGSQIKWFTTLIRGPHLIFSNSKVNMRSS